MAKFKNIHSETGKISFNGRRIEFTKFLETDDKSLIKFLQSNSGFIEVEEIAENKLSKQERQALALKKEAEEKAAAELLANEEAEKAANDQTNGL